MLSTFVVFSSSLGRVCCVGLAFVTSLLGMWFIPPALLALSVISLERLGIGNGKVVGMAASLICLTIVPLFLFGLAWYLFFRVKRADDMRLIWKYVLLGIAVGSIGPASTAIAVLGSMSYQCIRILVQQL